MNGFRSWPRPRQSFAATFLIGMGMMAAVDEIVFHQLLNWHHFYDESTLDWALFSDGLLHAGELIVIVGGFFLFADIRRRGTLAPSYAWGGFLIGAGAFQLWDGIIDHKVLRTHQIRYEVDILPYDLVWNGFAVLLLIAGAVIIARAHDTEREPAPARAGGHG